MIRHLSRPKKTVDDYMQLPDDVRAELIDGELLRSPSPKFRHQRIVTKLGSLLETHVDAHGLGALVVAPIDVHLPSGDIVQPDLVFVSTENRNIIQDWIRGVPDLVVEVISPGTSERDRFIKRDLYARNGISEYWIVDGESQSLEIFSIDGSHYAPSGYFQLEDTVQSPTFPELQFMVKDVLQ